MILGSWRPPMASGGCAPVCSLQLSSRNSPRVYDDAVAQARGGEEMGSARPGFLRPPEPEASCSPIRLALHYCGAIKRHQSAKRLLQGVTEARGAGLKTARLQTTHIPGRT